MPCPPKRIAPLTESAASGLLKDVWEARNAYISVILAAGMRQRNYALGKTSESR